MEFYHLINRGVDKRRVFMSESDYVRFIHDMYVFNDSQPAPNYIVKAREAERRRDMLVYIHAFSLMPNHYHLLVSPRKKGGMSLFMRKLNMGYAKYVNEKYGRAGVLWQGTFRKVLLERDAHFNYIPYYIHLNPLDMTFPGWRSGKVKNIRGALAFLRSFRWSSYLDYNGMKNFPSILHMAELRPILGTSRNQAEEIRSIISDPSLASASKNLEFEKA